MLFTKLKIVSKLLPRHFTTIALERLKHPLGASSVHLISFKQNNLGINSARACDLTGLESGRALDGAGSRILDLFRFGR